VIKDAWSVGKNPEKFAFVSWYSNVEKIVMKGT